MYDRDPGFSSYSTLQPGAERGNMTERVEEYQLHCAQHRSVETHTLFTGKELKALHSGVVSE